ncbi:MAG TPA: alpha/beta hydrolase [Hydrogenophaga sp.]|uniref:YheT family hydrolase n=1 Tax=Hydrogenophaga sp. TaxID=1904254 RepID=UPI002C61B365|nr:alpha/beta fold hydrolase [Hydrogenophaga sp.]HMN92106.1 alpha/beta hydrolase [Hydrogenophaga sp.]HMP10526.1 alpha/beta hydrolase [Hydrogenophaga sp.]
MPARRSPTELGASLDYRPPRWLPGGHLQTLWGALVARRHHGPAPLWRRERWTTPDGDFIDVDRVVQQAPSGAPLIVLFHGLEGSSASQYAVAFADFAISQRVDLAVPHFRGCSGELNLAPRAYHSGDFEEIDWILHRFAGQTPGRPMVAVGVSLGGNALLRWAGEMGHQAAAVVSAVAAVCSPLDLAAGGHAIGQGFSRLVYTRMFLSSMVPKALQKLEQHPGLFDGDALRAARDLYTFDNLFTAPLHGFRDTDDYWRRASAKPLLSDIRVPALALNALNDPFVPARSLPLAHEVGNHVQLWQPAHGGHVGFPASDGWPGLPGHVRQMPEAVGRWLLAHV